MTGLRAALLLARKDAAVFLRDPAAAIMAFLLPIVLATIFGTAMGAMGGGGGGIPRAALAVADEARSEASRALAERLAGVPVLSVRAMERGAAEAEVADGDLPAALVIPADWEPGGGAPLELLRDPGRSLEQEIVAGALLGVLLGPREGAYRPPARVLGDLPGVELRDVAGPDDEGEAEIAKAAARAHAVAGIAVMMLLFGLVQVGASVLDEERSGTLDRLRLARASGGAILGGKFVFAWAIGLAQLAVLFLYGALVFGLDLARAPLALLAVSASVSAAAAGFGMLVAALCRTQKQLEGLATLLILAMSAMGGSWFPLAMTPEWFQTVGHFTLNAWAMDGYQDVFWRGRGLAGVLPEAGVLAGIALATGAAAVALWRRRIGP